MKRYPAVAIAMIGTVLLLNLSAIAQTSTQPPAKGPAPGSAPAKTPGMSQPDPATKATGKGAMAGSEMSSERVRAIQEALKSKGHDPGPIDGILGPQTAAALKGFQKAEKLPESGRGDAQTLAKLGVQ
jgi:peptidoglycan hydrolase-like protein with peptidoglycan-binding domain